MFHHLLLLLVSPSLSSSLSLNEPMINSVMFNQWLTPSGCYFSTHTPESELILQIRFLLSPQHPHLFGWCHLVPLLFPLVHEHALTLLSLSSVHFPYQLTTPFLLTQTPHALSHFLSPLVFLSVSLSLCVWVWQNAVLASCKETEPGRHDNLKMKGWEKTLSAKITM